jgi:hypothetical protein
VDKNELWRGRARHPVPPTIHVRFTRCRYLGTVRPHSSPLLMSRYYRLVVVHYTVYRKVWLKYLSVLDNCRSCNWSTATVMLSSVLIFFFVKIILISQGRGKRLGALFCFCQVEPKSVRAVHELGRAYRVGCAGINPRPVYV